MINLLLSVIALILPWGNLLRFEILPNIFFRLLDFSAAFLLLGVLSQKRIGYFKILFSKYRAVVFFSFVLIVSNLFRGQYSLTLGGLFYLTRTLGYLLLIPFFFEKQVSKSLSLRSLVRLSLVIAVTTGLVQYWFYPDLRNLFYLGYDPHAYRLFV